jgi:hypothetical protein
MNADHHDPTERWRSVSDWYAEFAALQGWEFLAPMVGFARWVGSQPFAAALYPFTSHEHLCIRLRPGYFPDEPLIFALARPDGQFECGIRDGSGQLRVTLLGPIEAAPDAFASVLIRFGLDA